MTVTVSSTDPRSAKALALLARAHTWTHGRRKCDGLPFAIVAGSKPETTYMVSELGCTCRDANRRGVMCKHQTAYRLWLVQEGRTVFSTTVVEKTPGTLTCNDWGAELPAHVVGGSMCGSCWQARDAVKQDMIRAERAAYRARLRAELGMTEEAA